MDSSDDPFKFQEGRRDLQGFFKDAHGLNALCLLQTHTRMAMAVIPRALTAIGKSIGQQISGGLEIGIFLSLYLPRLVLVFFYSFDFFIDHIQELIELVRSALFLELYPGLRPTSGAGGDVHELEDILDDNCAMSTEDFLSEMTRYSPSSLLLVS